jgi:hypothetical protein
MVKQQLEENKDADLVFATLWLDVAYFFNFLSFPSLLVFLFQWRLS